MNGRTYGRTDVRTDERTDGWTDGRTDGRTDVRTDGRTTDGRKGGRTDGGTYWHMDEQSDAIGTDCISRMVWKVQTNGCTAGYNVWMDVRKIKRRMTGVTV